MEARLGLVWGASCTSDYTQSTYIFRLIIAGLKWRSQVSINSRNSVDLNIGKTVCVFIFFQPFEFLTLFIEYYIWISHFLWRSSEDRIYHFKMSLACFQKTACEILFCMLMNWAFLTIVLLLTSPQGACDYQLFNAMINHDSFIWRLGTSTASLFIKIPLNEGETKTFGILN